MKRAMFEHLSEFEIILVSGPQRSGTTICAKMVAQDTGHAYINEAEYQFHDETAFRAIVTAGGGLVIHCPPMCHLLHEFANDDGIAVILMRRDIKDIIASQEAINWTAKEEARELAKYKADYGPIALVKYDVWDRLQRDQFPEHRRFEIRYKDLRNHPLWQDQVEHPPFGYRQ